jgi:YhcH/YjgK/YiaL family protein
MEEQTTRYDLRWFDRCDWKEGWHVQADESIDPDEFIKHYSRHPERWQKSFKFLMDTDLKRLPVGRYELDGDRVFVNISQYKTKDDAPCEVHRKYIDIQYVISGEEQIGITPLNETEDATPYDEEKDVAFVQAEDLYAPAYPGNFFVFFPTDAHRPGISIERSITVKKAIVKILID